MIKLGIIGAMQVEVEALVNRMQHKTTRERAGSTFHEGILEDLPVVVVQCGVGKVNAAICTQILCDCYGVTHIINTGIAGSLCAELDIGDLVVSLDVMHHDFNCSVFGYPVGQVPGSDVTAYPADETLVGYAFDAANKANPGHTKIGRVASGDQFISQKDQKRGIVERTKALCTEMEGAAIGQTAYRNGVPFVILRAISDKADDSAEMDYPTFEKLAAKRCSEVTVSLAQHMASAEE